VDASTNVDFLVATGQQTGSAIMSLAAGDVLTLRNNSATPFTCDLAPGVGAQMNITKMASDFGYVYQLATLADATVIGGADIPFSNNGPLTGITHTAGTTTVTVPATGVYKIDYGVTITSGVGSAIAVVVNGAVDASTNVDFLVATGQQTGSAIMSLAAGDVLRLRNNSATPFTCDLAPGVGAQMNVTLLD
jgi:hypothetical protein